MLDSLNLGLLEDCPYSDITTELLGIDGMGTIDIMSRVNGITSGTYKLKSFFESRGATVTDCLEPSSGFTKGDLIFKATGHVKTLFKLWRISQTHLTILCAIATSTNEIVRAAREVNADIDIAVAARKAHLGMRAAEIDAVIDGGATYHRNSLSDTILITQNHLDAIGSLTYKPQSIRHKIEIEPRSEEEAFAVAGFVDTVLLDHFDPVSLPEICARLRDINPALKVGVAGGIDIGSVRAVAKAVDLIILSSVLYAKPLDFTCKIKKDQR